ncbi:helix-turn-helix transcriptional regulator [Actinomadura terrae]|uniref:helix-turn-helix transcriptional regulator n=1 Tax=Actinomadura terrae TaxID=604353 RepID=UPI0023430A55|nr:helix-turn-helix transcriptional regulator [Actinomadura terrae]
MALKRRRLAQRRRSMGYSQESLAEELNTDRSTVGRWERAETDPMPWIRPKLAQKLGITLDELNDLLTDVQQVPEQQGDRLDYALHNPSKVDLVAVAYLRQRVHDLADGYDDHPSALILAKAGQCHGQVSYLRQHTPSDRVRHELWTVESESAILMGQLVWDASQRRDHATALAFYDQAVTAARERCDPLTEGQAELRKCYVALYGARNPGEGLARARRAARISRNVSNVLTGLALLHAAEAYAMAGDQKNCEKMLGSAESTFARIQPDDLASEQFSPTQFGRLAGSCYLFLGNPAKAQVYLEQTAANLHAWQKSRAIVLGNLSLAHLRQENIDGAIEILNETIDILESTRGGGGLNIAFTAGRELRPWRQLTSVCDVHDRLLGLMTTA